MSWTPQMRWLDADGKPQRAFPELKLRFRFNHEAAARLFENASSGFAEIMAAADAGEPQGFGLPGMLTLSATTGLRRTESANVLGLLPGARSEPAATRSSSSRAHLDHLGRGSAVERRFDLQRRARQCRRHRRAAGDGARAARIEHEAAALGAVRGSHRRGERAARLGLFRAAARAATASASSRTSTSTCRCRSCRCAISWRSAREHSSLGALARNAAAAQGYRLSPEPAPEEVRLHPQRPVLVHSPRHPGAGAEQRLPARAIRASMQRPCSGSSARPTITSRATT